MRRSGMEIDVFSDGRNNALEEEAGKLELRVEKLLETELNEVVKLHGKSELFELLSREF